MTISAWIKPRKSQDAWQVVYRKEDGPARSVLAIGANDAQFGLWLGLGIGGEYHEIGGPLDRASISDGKWHFVAATFDGSTVGLFADGRELHAEPHKGAIDASGRSDAFIGSNGAKTEFFGGAIDDVRIYDRALSADDFAALAAGESPRIKPVAHWKLDGDLVDVASGQQGKMLGLDMLVRPKLLARPWWTIRRC